MTAKMKRNLSIAAIRANPFLMRRKPEDSFTRYVKGICGFVARVFSHTNVAVVLLKVKFTEVLDLVQHREVIVKGVSIFLARFTVTRIG